MNEPLIGEAELRNVTECVRSGWISSRGRFVAEFEERWAAYCGRRFGVAVNSGTTALQLAVAAAGIGPGDEVILPSFTIIASVLAVVSNGAVPVLVDADPATWCADAEQLAAKITARTRAIMPVHIYGHPVDMDAVLDLAERHGLIVIEDAAEAHGAEYHSRRVAAWQRCGRFGALSCFSFYANKIVTTGEGGMVVTDDRGLADRIRSLRNLGFGDDRRFRHEELGSSVRLTNLQAALGVAQLDRIDAIVARKRAVGRLYGRALEGCAGLQLPTERTWARNVYWMYGVVLGDEVPFDAAAWAERLREAGIETRPFFVGMHEQPVLRRRGLFEGEAYPVSERLSRRGLYLPSGTALTDAQIAEVCEAVRRTLS